MSDDDVRDDSDAMRSRRRASSALAGSSFSFDFGAGDYRRLELFVEVVDRGRQAWVAADGGRRIVLPRQARFRFIAVDLAEKRDRHTLSWQNLRFRFAYLSDCEDILDEGIRVLDLPGAAVGEGGVRALTHFQPPVGWMNDPNGLARFQGRWHWFYQFDPYAATWGPMHWGHAVSLDLIHWIDLPVFLFPDERLLEWDPTLTGGAFSGSAVPVDEEGRPVDGDSAAALRIFLTRHEHRIGHEHETMREWQVSLLTTDGVHAGPETTIIDVPDASEGPDRRDPKVDVSHDGPAIMVTGMRLPVSDLPRAGSPGRSDIPDEQRSVDHRSGWAASSAHSLPGETQPQAHGGEPAEEGDARCPAIVSFVNEDPHLSDSRWTATGPLLMDAGLREAGTVECPDLFALDGSSVVLAGLTRYREGVGGRFQPVRWYVGDLERHEGVNGVSAPRLSVKQAGWLDFGTSLYAPQTCAFAGRRILVGWIADQEGVLGPSAQAVSGALTLPRELRVKDGRLYQHPVMEVYRYGLGDILAQTSVPALSDSPDYATVRLDAPGNAFYADLELANPGQYDRFELRLASWKDGDCSLGFDDISHDHQARFRAEGLTELGSVDATSTLTSVRRVEVFYDRGIAEVFLNDGEKAGTFVVPDPRMEQGRLTATLPRDCELTVRSLAHRREEVAAGR